MDVNQYSLRPLKPKDAERMLEWMHDEDTTRFLRLDGKGATIETVLHFIQSADDETKNLHRAIVNEEDIYYGTISLKNIDREKEEAEYAISIHPDARGTGAAYQGSAHILAEAFHCLRLKNVYLNVLEENKRAVRFYEKMRTLGLQYSHQSEMDFSGQKKVLLWYNVGHDDFVPVTTCELPFISNKSNQPLVSVLIPTFENQEFLKECILSVFSQSYSHLEILIGDDASKSFDLDGLATWVKENASPSVCRVAIFCQPYNIGTVANLEFLLEKCHGEFVMHLAADDLLCNEKVIERFCQNAEQAGSEAEFFIGQTEMWDASLENKQADFLSADLIDLIQKGDLRRLLHRCITTAALPAANFYRKSIFQKTGDLRGSYRFVEDWPLSIRALRQSIAVHYVDQPVIKHRQGGISHPTDPQAYRRTILFYRDMIRIFQSEVEPHQSQFDPDAYQIAYQNHMDRCQKYRRFLVEEQCRESVRCIPETPLCQKPLYDEPIMISVILPCYNVAQTIDRALDSILMQRTDFRYEVIIVDDASVDDSIAHYEKYRKRFSDFHIILHKENHGNARAFYNGLCEAHGDFFCVLDGDDYYCVQDKLQKQVDFFRKDVDQEYVACAHHYLLDLGGGLVNIPTVGESQDLNYVSILNNNEGYYHTATYLFRNVFRGNVPEYFKEVIYRGDTPRTTFHLMFSGKKTKVLNFVGSVYSYTHQGIWSGMLKRQQFEYQIKYLTEHRTRLSSVYEIQRVDHVLKNNQNIAATVGDQQDNYAGITYDVALQKANLRLTLYRNTNTDFIRKGAYFSEYLDSLCASIGYMQMLSHSRYVLERRVSNSIVILMDSLVSTKEEKFYAVAQLATVHADKTVTLILTQMAKVPATVQNALYQYSNLCIQCASQHTPNRLNTLCEILRAATPSKCYILSQSDSYAQAMLQNSGCENICLVLPRSGCLTGISNSNIDVYFTFNANDYQMLQQRFRERVRYIPLWMANETGMSYRPFDGHDALITAYIVNPDFPGEGKKPYAYEDLVVALLKETGGLHYHIGEITSETIQRIKAKLRGSGVKEAAFVCFSIQDRLADFLLQERIDLVIASFPYPSERICMQVMAAGIPLAAFDGLQRLNQPAFLYDSAFTWRNIEEFAHNLGTLSAEVLKKHSESSKRHYMQRFSLQALKNSFCEGETTSLPQAGPVCDDRLQELNDYYSVFGLDRRIRIMDIQLPAPTRTKTMTSIEPEVAAADSVSSWGRFKERFKKWDSKLRLVIEKLMGKGIPRRAAKILLFLSPYAIYRKCKPLFSSTLGKRITHKKIDQKLNSLSENLNTVKGSIKKVDVITSRLNSVEASLKTLDQLSENLNAVKGSIKKVDVIASRLNSAEASLKTLDQLKEQHLEFQTLFSLLDTMAKHIQISVHTIETTLVPMRKGIDDTGILQRNNNQSLQKISTILEEQKNRIPTYNNDYERRVISSFYDAMQQENFPDRLMRLLHGLDQKSIETVLKILRRQREIRGTEGQSMDILTAEEKFKALDLKENFYPNIFQIKQDIYCYKGYFLPQQGFEPNVFDDACGTLMVDNIAATKNKAILDVGAFIGDSALIFSPLTEDIVYCFDAVKEQCALIKKTIELNGLRNIEVIYSALGDSEGTIEIGVEGAVSGPVGPGAGSQVREQAPMMTIDHFVQSRGLQVGLIKVDVEGFEQAVLRGAEQTIREQKPILLWSIYHTANDFLEIKPLIESWNLGYRFKIHKPSDRSLSREVLLIGEAI